MGVKRHFLHQFAEIHHFSKVREPALADIENPRTGSGEAVRKGFCLRPHNGRSHFSVYRKKEVELEQVVKNEAIKGSLEMAGAWLTCGSKSIPCI